ncbi:MAG: virulence RhuM family protein [candidate division Zixibacteria bacterium]|nr:virulence RhuM family protein [candidate division Zixibacteria bacterium]
MVDISIYQTEWGTVEVRVDQETVWLSQEQMEQLFGRERSVITKHVRNVFVEGELDEKSNVQNLHIAGSDKPIKFYNLDVIISVGYRVKSRQGTRFRQWAIGILREHLTQGYTLNRQRLEANARELEAAPSFCLSISSIATVVADLGNPDEIVRVFVGFQRYLYRQDVA